MVKRPTNQLIRPSRSYMPSVQLRTSLTRLPRTRHLPKRRKLRWRTIIYSKRADLDWGLTSSSVSWRGSEEHTAHYISPLQLVKDVVDAGRSVPRSSWSSGWLGVPRQSDELEPKLADTLAVIIRCFYNLYQGTLMQNHRLSVEAVGWCNSAGLHLDPDLLPDGNVVGEHPLIITANLFWLTNILNIQV